MVHVATMHRIWMQHHESTKQLETNNLSKIQKLRWDQTSRQHEMELMNQKDYMQRTLKEVKQKHIMEQKQIPRNLKVELLNDRMQLFCNLLCCFQFLTIIIIASPKSPMPPHRTSKRRDRKLNFGLKCFFLNFLEGRRSKHQKAVQRMH